MTDQKDKDELEKKLEEVQKEKQESEENSSKAGEPSIQELQSKIAELEKQLKEQSEIAKRAQYDYINLKMDFDRMQRIWDEKSKTMEVDVLISNVKKFLPFLETLRKSLVTIPAEQREEPLVKGLQMMYDNFLRTLEGLNIKAIESIGLEPDAVFHEPVNVVPTEDKKMKGKIVEEWERGFYYEKDGEKKVVVAAKVIVGN